MLHQQSPIHQLLPLLMIFFCHYPHYYSTHFSACQDIIIVICYVCVIPTCSLNYSGTPSNCFLTLTFVHHFDIMCM